MDETGNAYLIDSNSLIEVGLNYPRDIFPAVWELLETLIAKGRLRAPREVFRELSDLA